jgi:hypothetical protein
MINAIGSIKGYGATIGRKLHDCSNQGYDNFVDVLLYLDRQGIKEAKFKPLILIDYFSNFGNQRELIEIATLWDLFKQGEVKSLKRDIVDTNPTLKNIVSKYSTHHRKDGKEAASYTFLSSEAAIECLKECEKVVLFAGFDDIPMRIKIKNSLDILGYCDVQTGKECDRRRLLITDVTPLKNNGVMWSYRISTRSLGSGKTARLTVKVDIYNNKPINKGDIIYAADLYKNKAGYWYLTNYSIE